MLPTELLLSVFSYIPMHELQFQIQSVSTEWRRCAQEIVRKRLDGIVDLLQQAHSHKNSTTLHSIYDTEQERIASNRFTGWLLGNFEHPGDSQVVTGLQIQLEGWDRDTGLLSFVYTGLASFGMWVDHLGYISITRPYLWSKFNFSPLMKPTLRFWFHVETKNPNAKLLRHTNSSQSTPTTTSEILPQTGQHRLPLKDEFGIVGFVEYLIDPIKTTMEPTFDPEQLGGNLLQLLDEEEAKASGQLIRVLIHPLSIIVNKIFLYSSLV
jgi:hypothetical protein